MNNGSVERDFWTGSREAAPMSILRTGETIFHRNHMGIKEIKKVTPIKKVHETL